MEGVPQLMWQCPQHTVQNPNTASDPRDHLEKGLLQKEVGKMDSGKQWRCNRQGHSGLPLLTRILDYKKGTTGKANSDSTCP